jgi:DNA mismatch endonuclease (patch repair protein)
MSEDESKRSCMSSETAPPATSTAVANAMRGNRARDTTPERLLRRELWSMGYRGYRCNVRSLPGCPDICYTKQRVAIFVHGCFWHRCPKCHLPLPKTHANYWARKFERNVRRDAEKTEKIRSMGWRAVVVWECDIKRSPPDVARGVVALLERTC